MRRPLLLLLLALSSASPVAELDAPLLAAQLSARPLALLLYTRACGLCSAFQPHFQRLADAFGDNETLAFGRVDVQAHPSVAKALSASSVPFLTLLRPDTWLLPALEENGLRTPAPAARYGGPLDAHAAARWLASETGRELPWPHPVEELDLPGLRAVVEDGSSSVLLQFYGSRRVFFRRSVPTAPGRPRALTPSPPQLRALPRVRARVRTGGRRAGRPARLPRCPGGCKRPPLPGRCLEPHRPALLLPSPCRRTSCAARTGREV